MDKQQKEACIEKLSSFETKSIQALNRKFSLYLIFAVVYGFVFVNYIDVMSYSYMGYHLWLIIMYFFPFIVLTIFSSKNWQLTIGLGLIVSLMNDLFYGVVRNVLGSPLNLNWYYNAWLIPGNTTLFSLNLGFTVITVISWMMAISIYARIGAVFFLLRSWRAQAKLKCTNQT